MDHNSLLPSALSCLTSESIRGEPHGNRLPRQTYPEGGQSCGYFLEGEKTMAVLDPAEAQSPVSRRLNQAGSRMFGISNVPGSVGLIWVLCQPSETC